MNQKKHHLSLLFLEFKADQWRGSEAQELAKTVKETYKDVLKNGTISLLFKRLAILSGSFIIEYKNELFIPLKKALVNVVKKKFPEATIRYKEEYFPHVSLAYFEKYEGYCCKNFEELKNIALIVLEKDDDIRVSVLYKSKI